MSSITLTLTGKSSHLSTEFFPSIDLSDGDYECGLIDFISFNSIPNVDHTNNLFYFHGDDKPQSSIKNTLQNRKRRAIEYIDSVPIYTKITIPTGSYEIADLNRFLSKKLEEKGAKLSELEANKNTLQCNILCNRNIDFSRANTIGPLLGFKDKQLLEKNVVHTSNLPADVSKVNVIRVKCNIIRGAYLNSGSSHAIHEFSTRVPPGYKVIESPQNVIYLPVTVMRLQTLNLSVVDEDNNLIDFRGETVTIRLHLRKKC